MENDDIEIKLDIFPVDPSTLRKMKHTHVEILSPPLHWGPTDFRNRHLSSEDDEKRLFDPRCPRCVEEWAEKESPTGLTEKRFSQCMKALSDLYGLIWIEACYDPYNQKTKEFAETLLPHIRLLNDVLKFKR